MCKNKPCVDQSDKRRKDSSVNGLFFQSLVWQACWVFLWAKGFSHELLSWKASILEGCLPEQDNTSLKSPDSLPSHAETKQRVVRAHLGNGFPILRISAVPKAPKGVAKEPTKVPRMRTIWHMVGTTAKFYPHLSSMTLPLYLSSHPSYPSTKAARNKESGKRVEQGSTIVEGTKYYTSSSVVLQIFEWGLILVGSVARKVWNWVRE